MNSVYINLLISLSKGKINYCLLRNRPEKEAKLKDLDLLVHPLEYSKFIELCQKVGFIKIRSNRMNPFKSVLVAHLKQQFWTLDVHTEMVSRGLVYMDRDKVLKRKRMVKGYYFLSDEDLLLSLIFHNLIGKRSFSKKHLTEISNLLLYKLDYSYIHKITESYGLRDVFEDFIRCFHQMEKKETKFITFKKRTILSLRYRPISNLVRQILLLIRKRKEFILPTNRGLSIVFVGPDGIGKSSLVTAVGDYYSHFLFGSSKAYLGPWGGYRLSLWRIAKKIHLSPYTKNTYKYWSLKHLKFLIRGFSYYFVLWFELCYRYYKDVFSNLRRGKIVLIDRYIYDILIGHRNKEIKYFTHVRKLLCKFFPSPNVVFLLDASPDVMVQRKGELSIQEFTELSKKYKLILKNIKRGKIDIHFLNVDKSFQEINKEVIDIIWHKLAKR